MVANVSPFTTTYSVPVGTCGGGGGGGSGGGGLVSTGGNAVTLLPRPASGGLVGSVWLPAASGFSPSAGLRQPWISRAINAKTLRLMEKKTAIFSRALAFVFCSKKEPWGTNGLGLFIVFGAMASFL